MAGAEDPAAVLEAFVHDVANLPAEIQHLFEEAQVKQDQITECQRLIENRDGNIQKFIKHNTSLVPNPKEEQYSRTIMENYDKMRLLQDEKVMLVEKASTLLDRYVKRLDRKIADLQSEGSMALDPQMPSLLKTSPGNLVPIASGPPTGASTPLQPLSVNANAGNALANETVRRLAQATSIARMGGQPAVLNIQGTTILNTPSISTPHAIAAMNAMQRNHRELSAGSEKRRRLNVGLGALPAQPSNLARQSSLGPGTPKPTTPGGSRAGSAGPRPLKKTGQTSKKGPLSQLARRKLTKGGLPKKSARRLLGANRASPSTTGEDSGGGSEGSDEENASPAAAAEEEEEGEDYGEDDTKYCYCGQVSYGDMIACDNQDCKTQWFHWKCVGITAEPQGDWLCKDCAKLPNSKINRTG